MTNNTDKNQKYEYIYNLPYSETKELCRILDENNKWEELGSIYMQYGSQKMQELRKRLSKEHSPTAELLSMWGIQNHRLSELFILLSRMKQYQAMSVIKNFVDEKYHKEFLNGNEENLNVEQKVKFGDVRKRIQGNASVHVSIDTNENNESSVIINQPQLLKPKSPIPLGCLDNSNDFTISHISTIAESAGPIPQISYDELQKSTNNWDHSFILGKGGFGTVFKGVWKCTEVAIKRIEQRADVPESHSEQIKQSITELHCLVAYRHDNVLPLYGYSIGGPQPCLVYQYMSGGCLEKRLRDSTDVLSWSKRLSIAVGSARGLQFLHTLGEKPLIHGDIKSANILLDSNDIAKIGDFGLAREGPKSNYTHVTVKRIHGTRPYVPDEFLRAKKFSTKVDTYSFGVVLFEIATALSAYSDRRKHKFLKDHVVEYKGDIYELKDRRAENGRNCFKSLVDIGKLCVSARPSDRPEMKIVFELLDDVTF